MVQKTQMMTRGGQDLLRFNPFTVLLGSFRRNMAHIEALSFVFLLSFGIPLMHFVVFSFHFYSVVTQISKPKELNTGKKRGEK